MDMLAISSSILEFTITYTFTGKRNFLKKKILVIQRSIKIFMKDLWSEFMHNLIKILNRNWREKKMISFSIYLRGNKNVVFYAKLNVWNTFLKESFSQAVIFINRTISS